MGSHAVEELETYREREWDKIRKTSGTQPFISAKGRCPPYREKPAKTGQQLGSPRDLSNLRKENACNRQNFSESELNSSLLGKDPATKTTSGRERSPGGPTPWLNRHLQDPVTVFQSCRGAAGSLTSTSSWTRTPSQRLSGGSQHQAQLRQLFLQVESSLSRAPPGPVLRVPSSSLPLQETRTQCLHITGQQGMASVPSEEGLYPAAYASASS